MRLLIALLMGFFSPRLSYAFFGTEMVPLFQLVAGQVHEIERLEEQVGLAKDQQSFLVELNAGINRTVNQIEALQSILERAQGLDPTAVKSIADLNDFLSRAQDAQRSVDELLAIRINAAGVAIDQSATQGETAYLMGQEMVKAGSSLAQESTSASPGRASQISAATGSAQMLAQGVELQTLAQISQLQAITLDLQRTEFARTLSDRKQSSEYFNSRLLTQTKTTGPQGAGTAR